MTLNVKPADVMMNGDVLDYTTPNRYYTIRLHRHPGNVGHVIVFNNMTNSTEEFPPEEFGDAQARARSQATFLKMVDGKIGK